MKEISKGREIRQLLVEERNCGSWRSCREDQEECFVLVCAELTRTLRRGQDPVIACLPLIPKCLPKPGARVSVRGSVPDSVHKVSREMNSRVHPMLLGASGVLQPWDGFYTEGICSQESLGILLF